MTFWLTTFIVSGILLGLFIILKVIQERLSVLLFWPNTRERIEVSLGHRRNRVQAWFEKMNRLHFYIFLNYIVVKLRGVVVQIHTWLDNKSHRLISMIRGRQRLEHRGKPSYFLHDIASFRDKFRKK